MCFLRGYRYNNEIEKMMIHGFGRSANLECFKLSPETEEKS